MSELPADGVLEDNKLPENAQKWVDALRSGEYSQARNYLKYADSYCCLGVACDISGLGEWHNERYISSGQVKDTGLPDTVRDWLGIKTSAGGFYVLDKVNGIYASSLTELNDSVQLDFYGIADYIENKWYNLKAYDKETA